MSQDMAEPENIKRGKHSREKKPPKKITEKYLYNAGLAYLQRFTASVPHFRRIMGRKIDRSCTYHKDQEKDACLKMLDTAIETLTRQGMLNDDAYLQGMVTSLRRRGLSTQAILSKLQQKGLAQDSILTMLRSHDAERGANNPDLAAAAMLMRRKRLGAFRKVMEADKNKELAALARAGFGFDIAQRALSMDMGDIGELLTTIQS